MPIWSPGRHIPTQKIPKYPPGCRATDLLVVRLDSKKRQKRKLLKTRHLERELQLISWLDSSIELYYQFEKCYRGRTRWERKLINFMYTQYCKPAAVFPFKQRPLIRKLESYPLSDFYLRASIKHSFFLPACWAFLRTNKWLHHIPRLTKAWLKRSGFSTCLTKSHFDQEPLWLFMALSMTYYAHAYRQCSGLQAPLLPLKGKALWPQMRDGECSLEMKFKKNFTRVTFIDNEEEKLWYKTEQFSLRQIRI